MGRRVNKVSESDIKYATSFAELLEKHVTNLGSSWFQLRSILRT